MSTVHGESGVPQEAGRSPLDPEAQARVSFTGLSNLLERLTPWLQEVGSWIFGGLSAFSVVVIASLITVGPVDAAILMSTVALASGLPLNVTGILLLRLIKDTKDLGIDDLTLEAFRDAGFPDIEAHFPPPGRRASLHKRRARIGLHYAFAIAGTSTMLTFAGLGAALWHMAWWIAVTFLAVVVLSVVLAILAIAQAQPPEAAAERELPRRARERLHGSSH